jgi:F1F0 ATPase subunit 2
MTDVLTMLVAALVGGVCAFSYFGGLWWTVRQLPTARHPSAMYFASLVLRLALLLAGFLLVLLCLDGVRLAACLVGFLVARFIVVHLLSCAVPLARTIEEGT